MDIFTALLAGATSGGHAATSLFDMLLTASDPAKTAVWMPAALEFAAVIAGALSGALTACEKRLDILGVCVLALITSLGGGLIRDMILSNGSIYMLDHPDAVIGCLVTGLVAFFFVGLLYKLNKPIAVFDIISVALFTYSGADKTLTCGYGFVACVLMGVLTGVGGGMCRDICLGRIPNIFKSSNFYAICSLAGAVVYLVMLRCHVVKAVAAAACVAVVLVLRWLSLHYNLTTAVPVDLTPKIVKPFKRMRLRYLRTHDDKDPTTDTTDNATDSTTDNTTDSTTPAPSSTQKPPKKILRILHPLSKRQPTDAVESWSDTPERRELEARKEREFREDDDTTQ